MTESEEEQKKLKNLRQDSHLQSYFEDHDHSFPDCDLIQTHIKSESIIDQVLAEEDFSDAGWPSSSGEEETHLPGRNPEPDGSIDSLAFYLPYHFYDRYWGIYIKPEGIQYLRKEFSTFFTTFSIGVFDQIKIAKSLLYHHELYHNHIEGFASSLQAVNFIDKIYIDYFHKAYEKSLVSVDGSIEETCANSFAREKLLREEFIQTINFSGDKKGLRGSLRNCINDFFSKQPKGYSRASKTKTGWDKSIRGELLSYYSATLDQRSNPYRGSNSNDIWKGTSSDQSYVPNLIKERVFYFIGSNSKYFGQKSAKYPNLKKKNFIKKLKKNFEFVREQPGGKHSQLVIPPKTIPYTTKRDWVEPYLIQQVCEALGITEIDLMKTIM